MRKVPIFSSFFPPTRGERDLPPSSSKVDAGVSDPGESGLPLASRWKSKVDPSLLIAGPWLLVVFPLPLGKDTSFSSPPIGNTDSAFYQR